MNHFEALKIFCTLSETLHFKETAKQLAISPQVVTRTINELEKTLGEMLFQRSTRQVKLTEFGKQFLPQASKCWWIWTLFLPAIIKLKMNALQVWCVLPSPIFR